MPNTAQILFSNTKLEPALRDDMAVMISGKLAPSTNYAQGALLGEQVGTNAIHKLTPSNGANFVNGGTFTLTFGGQTTPAQSVNAAASDIQSALEALSSIGKGNVLVTGGPIASSVVYIQYRGTLANAAQTTISVTPSVTGGTTPTITASSAQTGVAGTPGQYAPYVETNTDGSQFPKALLPYACQTDASGNITLSGTSGQAGGEFGQTYKSVPLYVAGFFNTADIVGLDGSALAQGNLILQQGTLGAGIVRIF